MLEIYDGSKGDSLTEDEQQEASRLFGELQALGPPPEEVIDRIVPAASSSSSSGEKHAAAAAAPASKEDAEEFAQFLKGVMLAAFRLRYDDDGQMGFGGTSAEGNSGMDEESAKVMKEMIDNPGNGCCSWSSIGHVVGRSTTPNDGGSGQGHAGRLQGRRQ